MIIRCMNSILQVSCFLSPLSSCNVRRARTVKNVLLTCTEKQWRHFRFVVENSVWQSIAQGFPEDLGTTDSWPIQWTVYGLQWTSSLEAKEYKTNDSMLSGLGLALFFSILILFYITYQFALSGGAKCLWPSLKINVSIKRLWFIQALYWQSNSMNL